ncbi:hypothetical protein B5F40_10530 [Gordonibacter sp. An230]|nr:hypothetical protein B5F40_10530 [Gordonibacter sp. An230]
MLEGEMPLWVRCGREGEEEGSFCRQAKIVMGENSSDCGSRPLQPSESEGLLVRRSKGSPKCRRDLLGGPAWLLSSLVLAVQ